MTGLPPLDPAEFPAVFDAIHGHAPYAWQTRLANEIAESGVWPGGIAAPTGAGKTAVLDVALFHLALNADTRPRTAPMRIVLAVDRRIIVDQYLAGAYILDPFYDAIRQNAEERLIVMRDLAPDDFLQSEYHRRHYASTSITDEIGFVLKLGQDRTAVLSLCRIGMTDPFSAKEIERFAAVAGLVCRIGERHWMGGRLSSPDSGRPAPTIDHPLLTPREREIVMLILKGHSSVSIAMVLSLSPDTVKAHRRHIYAKLNISSQAELFRTFLIDRA